MNVALYAEALREFREANAWYADQGVPAKGRELRTRKPKGHDPIGRWRSSILVLRRSNIEIVRAHQVRTGSVAVLQPRLEPFFESREPCRGARVHRADPLLGAVKVDEEPRLE
jgi:hypothetical protein